MYFQFQYPHVRVNSQEKDSKLIEIDKNRLRDIQKR